MIKDATLWDRARQTAVLISAIGQSTVPVLPSLGFGQEVGDRSDVVKTPLTPVDAAFSIWGLIFAACLVYAVHQALPREGSRPLFRAIGWPTALAFTSNALWELDVIFRGFGSLSVALIVMILFAILTAHVRYRRLGAAVDPVYRWTTGPAIGLLSGWISAATVVNLASVSLLFGSDLPTSTVAAILALLAAALFATGVQYVAGSSAWYGGAFAWAAAGIAMANGENAIGWVAAAVALAIVAAATLSEMRRLRSGSR